jgi:hypothetical protein
MCFNVFLLLFLLLLLLLLLFCFFVADYDGDDKVYIATILDCSLRHNLCYWLPFCEAVFCSMNYSA